MNTRHRGKDKSTENVLKIESVKRDLISDSALLPDNFIALQSTMFSSRPSTNVCSMLLRAPGCQTLKISPPFYQQGRSGFFSSSWLVLFITQSCRLIPAMLCIPPTYMLNNSLSSLERDGKSHSFQRALPEMMTHHSTLNGLSESCKSFYI